MKQFFALLLGVTIGGYIGGVVHAQVYPSSAQLAPTPNDGDCLRSTSGSLDWDTCPGASGGDSVSIDGSAVTDPDFVSTGDIDFVDTSNTITANINAGSIIETDLDGDVEPTDGDYLQYDSTGTNFTWRSASEVKTDLSLNNVENTALSTWVGSTALTTVGTIGTGVWQGTALTDTYVSDTITVGASGSVNDSALSANVSLLGSTIAPTELASADFGDFTCNGTTCSLDSTYLTGNQTITLSGDISGSGATSIAATIAANAVEESMLKAVDTAADEECLTYETTTGDFEWQPCGAGGGDLWSDAVDSNIIPDTSSTYSIGNSTHYFSSIYLDAIYLGDFGAATFYDNNGNEIWQLNGTPSAVNFLAQGNSATGNPISLEANGDDTNVSINILPKGSGEVQVVGQQIIDESMISTGLTYSAGVVTADLGTSIDTSEITDDTITHADIADSDQTTTMCVYIEDPTADDDLKSIWANKTANDFLLTELWAESDQTVNLDLQVDDGTPADVNGTDISPAAGEAEDTSLSGDTTVAAGEELDLAITSVSGTPTWVSICWTGNWVD